MPIDVGSDMTTLPITLNLNSSLSIAKHPLKKQTTMGCKNDIVKSFVAFLIPVPQRYSSLCLGS